MGLFEEMARKELKSRRVRGRGIVGVVPMMEWVPKITPSYMEPRHLSPLTVTLEAWKEKPFNIVVSTPPRHGKTETVLHFIAWVLAHDPTVTIAYVTYQEALALSKSRKALAYARAAGVEIASSALHEWRTLQGGGLLATGIGGPLTGQGVQILIVDDPVKNRVAAESPAQREHTWEWFNDVAFTRIEPGGSCAVIQTRWHDDDLAGRLIKMSKGQSAGEDADASTTGRAVWRNIHMPAINEQGVALWPERWSLADLAAKRGQVGEYAWASLYQGSPVPRGMSLFKDPHFYSTLPTVGWRHALGVDLAYTAKRKADSSVYVRMMAVGSGEDTICYVTDVCRKQEPAPQFRDRIKFAQRQWKGIPTRFYCGGVELGTADFFAEGGVDLGATNAYADKFVRAQSMATAWNQGKVLLPENAPWLDDYITEVTSFSGAGDLHDDQVDASVGAFDILKPSAPANRLRAMVGAR
jgi:predicted phage terminase large subunit-like protein